MASSFIQTIDNALKSALLTRFGTFFAISDANKDIVFAPKVAAQRMLAEKRGEATVEFISLYRTGIRTDWNRQNTPIARKGLSVVFQDSSSKEEIITIKATPSIIDYEIYFWSKDLDATAQAIESYLKWFQDYPNLVLYYQGLYEMDMYLKFGAVVDETDYHIYERGKYFVTRLPITLDGWVMTNVLTRSVKEIILDIYLREGVAPNYKDTLVAEYIITSSS